MSVSFGITNASIAARTATDTYGTLVDVPYVQMMGAELRVQSAEGNGDDKIAVVASRIIAGSSNVRILGNPHEVLEVVLGLTQAVTGVTPDQVWTIKIPGGQRLPGFGLTGQGLNEEDLGDQVIFAPYLKITSNITVQTMEFGAFGALEFTAMAVDDATYGIMQLMEQETAGDVTIPPVGAA